MARIRHEDNDAQGNVKIQNKFGKQIVDERRLQKLDVWGLRPPDSELKLQQVEYGKMPFPLLGQVRGKLILLPEDWRHTHLITQN
jgi:hypothetical protein